MEIFNYIIQLDENQNIVNVYQELSHDENQQENQYFTINENNEKVSFEPVQQGIYTGKWYKKSEYDEQAEILFHFNQVKENKKAENDVVCFDFRMNHKINYTINNTELLFESNRRTYVDLGFLKMSLERKHHRKWVDEKGTVFEFTEPTQVDELLDAIDSIYDRAYELWSFYNKQIDSAKTVEELEAIHIDYTKEIA